MVRRFFEDEANGQEQGAVATAVPTPVTAELTPFSLTRVAGREERAGAPRRRTRRAFGRGDLLAVLFLCLVAVAYTWPLARHPASTLPDLGDPIDSVWRLSWPIHQLQNNPRGLLDANTYYPFKTTYLFDELILGIALVVAPVTILSGNGVLAFNTALLLAFAMNGVAMYLLGRHLTGNRVAAVAGALVFAAAPFRLQHLGHLGLSTAYWLPLTLLFLDRTLLHPRRRDVVLLGLCAAMQALSAQYYGFQTVIVVGLYLLWGVVRRREWVRNGPFVLRLIAAIILAEALLFPVVAPYITVKGVWGYSRGLEENELYSATLSSFLATDPGNIVGGRLATAARRTLGIASWTAWLYPGLGAVAVALLGLLRQRWRWVPPGEGGPEGESRPRDLYSFFLGLALFGAAMCLGPTLYLQRIERPGGVTWLMPYRAVFNLVPGFDAMRAPERFGNVLLLGLGGAVAFGAAAVLARVERPIRRGLAGAVRVAVAVLLVAVVGAEYLHAPIRPTAVPPTPPVYVWLGAQPPGPVLELPLEVPAGEPNREQLRQYWSMPGWHPRVNGSSDLAPRAYPALRRDLELFPDPRTLGILQGLGVRYVIVHRAQYRRLGWEAVAARYESYGVTLQPRGVFGDDLAYELQPDGRFDTLRRTIPAGDDVFLSGADPALSDAYMATIGWTLRDHRLITRIIPTFGQRYTRPEPGRLADYVVCYKGEDPTRYGYPAGMATVYEDNVVRVYRRAR